MTEEYFKQTAEDYDLDIEIVEEIFLECENSEEFYKRLDKVIKEE